MSGVAPQNQDELNGSGYVNFNQFILQHNIDGPFGTQFTDCYNQNYNQLLPYMPSTSDYNIFQPQPSSSVQELAANSTLAPTAAEFIPRLNNICISEQEPQVDFSFSAGENGETRTTGSERDNLNQSGSRDRTQRNRSSTGAISKRSYNHVRNQYYDQRRYERTNNTGNGSNHNISRYNQRPDNKGNGSRYGRSNGKDTWRSQKELSTGKRHNSNNQPDSPKTSSTSQEDTTEPTVKNVFSNSETEKYSQREKLIREIESRKLECLVCVEAIKPHHSIWSCSNCYHILHLNCTTKWASSSKSAGGWRCPACQNVTKVIPRFYFCFCGKTKNPQYNRSDTAHSCGEPCGHKETCPHPCTLLCHPGPCPPCQAIVTRECGCGKTSKSMQCCIKEDLQCDEKCGKLLNCELHECEEKCHKGRCPNCTHKLDQQCFCGKIERQVACTRDSNDKKQFSCGKPCNKELSCGNHKCKDNCHTGACRPCKLTAENVTSCPCGKMPIVAGERASCLDPIPTCNGICGRTLKCGPPASPHHCASKCHTGNCPPCNKQTAVKCRCGHMDQMIKCRQLVTRADDARCKKRCTKKRSCGKHKCAQECCIDIDHICPMPCNHTLSCGKHKCDQPCHRGNCAPCYRSSFDELYCECGANVIYPPVPCGTKRPVCNNPCSRTHPCEHPVQHNCHSQPVCPPCIVLTTKTCYGGHEQRKTIPCTQASFSCGLPCNKDLPCGRHKCIKSCHGGICQVAGEVCKQNCQALRPNCGHKCNAMCHDGDCPDTPCRENVEVTCECGNRKQMRTCHDFSNEYRRIATAQLATSMQEMQRGNMVELSDILGPIKLTNNKTLECNDECKVLERNRRLAIGLQIRNPDLQSKLLTRYSDFIRGWAKKDINLVTTIHNKLTELVKLAKESKQRSRSHSFPTMNKEKRQLVHEMCGMFGVDSVAYDAEPNRNVVATAYKERSWLPAMSIMEVMQRESGQRRVPVPNNNAWGIKK